MDDGIGRGSPSGDTHPGPGASARRSSSRKSRPSRERTSIDHAVEEAPKASRTIGDIEETWVHGRKATVENNRIVEYRVNARIPSVVKRHG